MALLFIDGFDHYTEASDRHLDKWDAESSTFGVAISSGNGQSGSDSMRATSSINWQKNITQPTTVNENTLTAGFWFKTTSSTSGQAGLFGWYHDTTRQMDITFFNKRLCIRDFNNVEYWVPGVHFGNSREFYIEFKTFCDPTGGTCEVRIDGDTKLTLSDMDFGNDIPNKFYFGPAGTTLSTSDFDDLYVLDATGTSFNDFLGPIRVETLFPNLAGTTSDWTVLTGPANYEDVDETPPDDDTTYVSSSTLNNVDTYNVDSLSTTSGTVSGVNVVAYARKEGVSARTMTFAARENVTQSDDQDEIGLQDIYKFRNGLFDQNPDTSSAWTVSEINTAEFGMKLKS